MRKTAFLLSLIIAAASNLVGQATDKEIKIIPQPQFVESKDGVFILPKTLKIGYSPTLKVYAEMLSERLGTFHNYQIEIQEGEGTISLQKDPRNITEPEGYSIEVGPEGIKISGNDDAGVFYGIQTLLQLMSAEIYSDKSKRNQKAIEIPYVEIYDSPERPWRGMLLDVARYFHSKEYVKHFIDMMAMYKLNKLQLHLIDDSGWRIESEKYPLLTEKGSYAGPKESREGGYYTKDDMRELIEYGRLRNVEIVPEIEFPAHILSAIVAYPWLSCRGEQEELPLQHFISPDLLCVGKESSINFLNDILDETIELFPSEYVNIGGDEAVYDRWEECTYCQELKKREGLKETSELQGWLTDTIAKTLRSKGKTAVGWEEIINRGKVSEPVVALIWHNVDDTLNVKNAGHKSILTPAPFTYLDFPESATPGEVQAATWLPPVSMEKVYSMPVNDYSPESTVIGVQGAIWSDQFIHGDKLRGLRVIDDDRASKYIDYMVFPRMMALSEVAWGKESRRDYKDFIKRASSHYDKLYNKGINFRVPEPVISKTTETEDGPIYIELTKTVEPSEIVYTLDGTYPTVHSKRYEGKPVKLEPGQTIHASTLYTDGRLSLPAIE